MLNHGHGEKLLYPGAVRVRLTISDNLLDKRLQIVARGVDDPYCADMIVTGISTKKNNPRHILGNSSCSANADESDLVNWARKSLFAFKARCGK